MLLSLFDDREGDFVSLRNFIQLILTSPSNDRVEEVLFEAFEVSALSEAVLAAKGPLQWDFPGNAVAIPMSIFSDLKFQAELATVLEKASVESIKRFAAQYVFFVPYIRRKKIKNGY